MKICKYCDKKATSLGLCKKHYNFEYRQRPEVKEKQKEYHDKYLNKLGIREKYRKYQVKYRKDPEVKKRLKILSDDYYNQEKEMWQKQTPEEQLENMMKFTKDTLKKLEAKNEN